MRKLIQKELVLSTIVVAVILLAGVVLAQNENLPNAGLTPDSPFYFLDTLGEKIGMFFTFSSEKKAEKALKYAEEKLAEVKVMAEKNKNKAAEKAEQKYQEFLNLALQKGKNVENLATLIAERTLTHQEILQELFEKVPPEAQKGIERAIEASQNGYEEAIKAVSGEKKEELEKKAEEFKSKKEPKEIEKETRRYPRTTELFETCARIIGLSDMFSGLSLEEIINLPDEKLGQIPYFDFYIVTEKDLEGFSNAGLKPEDFEKSLSEGIIKENEALSLYEGAMGMGGIGGFSSCKNNLMDKNLRPKEYDEICSKNPSCCDLPEPKDIDSALKLIKKIEKCKGEESKEPKIEEMTKLKYGYLFFSPYFAGTIPYYLTNTGCLFDCFGPYGVLAGIHKAKKLEFEALPELKEFKNKAPQLLKKAISEKKPELCEEIKMELNEVEAAAKEKISGEVKGFLVEYNYGYYDECIKSVAIETKNTELCKKLPDSVWVNECVRQITTGGAEIKDARIQADLSQVRAIAELLQADTDSYVDLCETSNNTLNQRATNPYGMQLNAIESDIITQGGSSTCYANAKNYCVSASLVSPGAGYFCVDSSGRTLTTTNNTCDATNFDCL